MNRVISAFVFILMLFATQVAFAKPDTVLIDENTIILRGEVNTESVSKVVAQMLTSKQEVVTIFIDSPGGSVVDGLFLTNIIQNFDKPTRCLVNYAASMAFAIAQVCTERLVMSSSIMMQHQMSMGVKDSLGKIQEIVRFGGTINEELTALQADRIGMSVKNFQARVLNDWFLFGKEAVKENVADKVVFMKCTPALVEKKVEEEVQVFIFRVKIIWSGCPLIVIPLEVKMPGSGTEQDKNKVKSLLSDRDLYVKELRGK